MSQITGTIGQRIRNYRNQRGWSQEKLAELAGCHPTYVGQIERGEKNATIESIERIARALEISLSKLFEMIGEGIDGKEDIPLKCYEFIASKSKSDQEQLYRILVEMDNYKSK